MGSKNLKAVVLRGGEVPPVYDSERLMDLSQWFETEMHNNVLSMWQKNRPGFGVWIHTHGIEAAVCVNNYQTSQCDNLDAYAPEAFAPYYQGESPCPSCPNQCIKNYSTNVDDAASGGLHQEALGALGPNTGCADVGKIVRTNILCNAYGLDPNALGYTISFAQECVENQLLNPGELNLSFSNDVDLEKLTTDIALRRTELGNLLAEGSFRAALAVGKAAVPFSMTVKKTELTPFELRTQTNLALGFATASVGPRYEICEHDWDFDLTFGWEHTLNYCRTLGILERIPMNLLSVEKVRNFKALNHLWYGVESLGMCIFASAPTRVYSPEKIAELIHAVTGYESSFYEVMRLGERKNHLFRLYNYREGFTAKDDILPDRFFEYEIDAGALAGSKIDKAKFLEVIKYYYQMMGWDEEGRPLLATLSDLGLSDFGLIGQSTQQLF